MNYLFNSTLVFAAALATIGCQTAPLVLPPLAIGQLNVTALTGDGNNVYWTTGDGFVRSVSTSGGAVAELAQGLVLPTQIALDDDSVYWAATGSGSIGRAPKVGGATETLFENEDGLGSLQVDDTSVYWLRAITEVTTSGQGQVRKAPKTVGATVQTLLSDSLDPGALALNGSLYFPAGVAATPETPALATTGLYTLPTTGGTAVAAVSGSFDSVVTYGANICSAGPDAQALSLDSSSTAQAITCTALDGSNPNVVAAGLANVVTTMTLDDTTVYFGTADGTMSAVALDGTSPIVTGPVTSPDDGTVVGTTSTGGSGPVTFATGPAGSASLAVDITQVYWAHTNGNAIFAMPKF
jgi:hypothetical protein